MSAVAEAVLPSTTTDTDLGIWATWYDLSEDERDSHLTWVHETHIPMLLKHDGYLWAAHYESIPEPTAGRVKHTLDASVPTGKDYILLVGAKDGNVFGWPTPDEVYTSLPEASKKMLSMRKNARWNIFVDCSRVTGAGFSDYKGGMTPAPCIQFGTYCVDERREIDILAWYAQLQMPRRDPSAHGSSRPWPAGPKWASSMNLRRSTCVTSTLDRARRVLASGENRSKPFSTRRARLMSRAGSGRQWCDSRQSGQNTTNLRKTPSPQFGAYARSLRLCKVSL